MRRLLGLALATCAIALPVLLGAALPAKAAAATYADFEGTYAGYVKASNGKIYPITIILQDAGNQEVRVTAEAGGITRTYLVEPGWKNAKHEQFGFAIYDHVIGARVYASATFTATRPDYTGTGSGEASKGSQEWTGTGNVRMVSHEVVGPAPHEAVSAWFASHPPPPGKQGFSPVEKPALVYAVDGATEPLSSGQGAAVDTQDLLEAEVILFVALALLVLLVLLLGGTFAETSFGSWALQRGGPGAVEPSMRYVLEPEESKDHAGTPDTS